MLFRSKIEIVTHESLIVAEAEWLASRIGRAGKMTPNQRALLIYLKGESPLLHPALRALIDRAIPVPA